MVWRGMSKEVLEGVVVRSRIRNEFNVNVYFLQYPFSNIVLRVVTIGCPI